MLYDVIVIGAGPAGMTAAIYAHKKNNNMRILVIEKNKKTGRKLYATGNGRCNIANTALDLSCYECNREFFPYEVVTADSYKTVCDYMNMLGVDVTDRDGYLYPSSMQASSVVWAMTDKLKSIGTDIVLNEECTDISKENELYRVTTDKNTYTTRNIILAPGGAAAPKLGGTTDVYKFAGKLNLNCYNAYPALCRLKTKQDISMLSGVRTKASAILVVNDTEYLTESGELQFTDEYLSGIMIFNLSCNAGSLFSEGLGLKIYIELLPDKNKSEIQSFLENASVTCPYRSIYGVLNGLVNEKIAQYILEKLKSDKIITDKKAEISSLDTKAIRNITDILKRLEFDIEGCGSFDDAQVTSGGIDTMCINPKTCGVYGYDGLFIAGEYLDVTGKCGGYNIMWAVISGMRAGESVI